MSYKGSEKEFILSASLLQNPGVLEEAIGIKLGKMEAEVPVGRKKVDLLAVETNRRLPVFIEIQIKPSDPLHLNTIHGILDFISEGIIIWIARSFKQQHLEQVISYLKRNKQKYIAFYAMKVHSDVITRVEQLNQLYKLDIWYQLKRISEIEHPPLKRIYAYSQIPPTHTGRVVETVNYDLTRVEDVKQYILDSLRNKVPYCPNIWKAKKHNRFENQLSIGAGRGGTTFKISVRNQQGFAGIFLHFDRNQRQLYNTFRKDIQKFRDKIHPDLSASKRKLGVLFEPDPELDVTISKLASILERMLLHFGPQLYGGYGTMETVKTAPEKETDKIDNMRIV